ncbi:MAG TPA: hypothetical protein VHS59_08230 [Bacillota bacterium]|nr:hypothetical protein [Bacillota bacterium]
MDKTTLRLVKAVVIAAGIVMAVGGQVCSSFNHMVAPEPAVQFFKLTGTETARPTLTMLGTSVQIPAAELKREYRIVRLRAEERLKSVPVDELQAQAAAAGEKMVTELQQWWEELAREHQWRFVAVKKR